MGGNSQRDLFAPILSSDALMGPLLLIARLFMTTIFAFYIVNALAGAQASGGLIYLAIAIQIFGIAFVALGYKTRFVALFLAAYCIFTILMSHGNARLTGIYMTDVQKGLAVVGGFLFMFAYGPGPLSLDGLRDRGKQGVLAENSHLSFFSPILDNKMLMGTLLFLGRVLIVLIFVTAGTNKILHTSRMQDYMVRHNPHVPTNLIYLAIVTQVVAPLLVFLGFKTRYGALALSGFCIIATVLFHADFGKQSEVAQFFLDFANAGGLLFMFAYGPGLLSVDALRHSTAVRNAASASV